MTANAIPCAYRLPGHPRVTIEWRGGDRWVVTRGSAACLNRLGEWEYEPLPSNRTDEFIARTRYSLDDAIGRAAIAVADEPEEADPE